MAKTETKEMSEEPEFQPCQYLQFPDGIPGNPEPRFCDKPAYYRYKYRINYPGLDPKTIVLCREHGESIPGPVDYELTKLYE